MRPELALAPDRDPFIGPHHGNDIATGRYMNYSLSLLVTALAILAASLNSAQAQRKLVGNLICTADLPSDKQAGRAIECKLQGVQGQPAKFKGGILRLTGPQHENEQLVFNWAILSDLTTFESAALEGRFVQTPNSKVPAISNLIGGRDNKIVLQPLDDYGGAFAVLELELSSTRV